MHKASRANQRGASVRAHTWSRFLFMGIQRLAYIGGLVYELMIPFCFLIDTSTFYTEERLFEWDH